MVLLFYVGDYLMFRPSKDKIDEVYASFQEYFNIEMLESSTSIMGQSWTAAHMDQYI